MMNPLMLCLCVCVCVCVYCARSGQRGSVGMWHVASMTVLWFTQSWPAGISRLWVWHHAAGGHAGPLNVIEIEPGWALRPNSPVNSWNWSLFVCVCLLFGMCCASTSPVGFKERKLLLYIFCNNNKKLTWMHTVHQRYVVCTIANLNCLIVISSKNVNYIITQRYKLNIQVHLNKLECRGKVHLFQ